MKIPKGRIRRSAKLGSAIGAQGARYAGTKAANVARSDDDAEEQLEPRHLETALKMVGALGEMKGAAMKIGQLASFIDTEFLPARVPRDLPGAAREAAHRRAADAVGEGRARCSRRSTTEPVEELFARVRARRPFAAASIGQVHRAELLDGRRVAVKIQYPGDRRGARGRPAQRRA